MKNFEKPVLLSSEKLRTKNDDNLKIQNSQKNEDNIKGRWAKNENNLK